MTERDTEDRPKVVVVDDDTATTKQLVEISFRMNELTEVFDQLDFFWCINEDEFHSVIRNQPADIIISDLKLLDTDGNEDKQLGHDVVANARKISDAAIIVFSSQPSEADEATTLKEGADDYVEKNSAPHRIALRILYWLKRVSKPPLADPATFKIGTWIFTPGALYVSPAFANGPGQKLSYAEHDLLKALCLSRTHSISREEFNVCILNRDEKVSDRRLDNQIRRLRAKLLNAGLIQSIRGGGYRLSDVQKVNLPDPVARRLRRV